MASETIMDIAPATIEVRPHSFHIGAEIDGVDLTRPLSAASVAEIRAAFLKWKVVFFRGQSLDHGQHLAFARQFGDLTVGHAVFGNVENYPEIYSISKHRKSNRYEGPSMVRPWTGHGPAGTPISRRRSTRPPPRSCAA
jgi:taurine dioxygenase